MERAICVYSSSSDSVSEEFFVAARHLGAQIAQQEYTLIYGGSDVGLMGAVARAARANGGRVVGIIPQALYDYGIADLKADELIVTTDMRERKALMESRASAFVALPGGFGTLEEVLEILTLKQLQYHAKPISLLNVASFYNPLIELFNHLYAHRFAKEEFQQLYHVAQEVPDLFTYLDGYQAPSPLTKWSGSKG